MALLNGRSSQSVCASTQSPQDQLGFHVESSIISFVYVNKQCPVPSARNQPHAVHSAGCKQCPRPPSGSERPYQTPCPEVQYGFFDEPAPLRAILVYGLPPATPAENKLRPVPSAGNEVRNGTLVKNEQFSGPSTGQKLRQTPCENKKCARTPVFDELRLRTQVGNVLPSQSPCPQVQFGFFDGPSPLPNISLGEQRLRPPDDNEQRSGTPAGHELRPRTLAEHELRPRTLAEHGLRPGTPAEREQRPRTPVGNKQRPKTPALNGLPPQSPCPQVQFGFFDEPSPLLDILVDDSRPGTPVWNELSSRAGSEPTVSPEIVFTSAQLGPTVTFESKVSSAKSSHHPECRLAMLDCEMAIRSCEISLEHGTLARDSHHYSLSYLKRKRDSVTSMLAFARVQLACCTCWLDFAESKLSSGERRLDSAATLVSEEATKAAIIDWDKCPFSRHSAMEWMFYVEKKLEFIYSQLICIAGQLDWEQL